jgi:hypothetical protein
LGSVVSRREFVNPEPCAVLELRRYALRPGARDTLIELFDREFVETQEELGMQLLGQFRDLDNPDSFVWLRGFADMKARKRGLEAFYGGHVWRANAAVANATMIDSDNVLLLRPLRGLELEPLTRAPAGSTAIPPGLFVITIYPLMGSVADAFADFFLRELQPAFAEAEISVLATYATEHSENTFPALPVREGEDVFVWMTMFANEEDHARHMLELEQSTLWRDRTSQALEARLAGSAEVLRLRPTARSLIHG